MAPSRWADTEEDAAAQAKRRRDKEQKKRDKARKLEEQERKKSELESQRAAAEDSQPPAKRRKTSPGAADDAPVDSSKPELRILRPPSATWAPCRSVDNYEKLNHIEEGSYGWVSRARDSVTGEVVALKKLKVDDINTNGLPVTGMREIECLRDCSHEHIVGLKEVVVGSTLDSVFLVMEFLEHDLRTLQEDMQEPFLPSEVKTLMLQLTSAVDYLHDHWILHRDLKTSNILMNNRGEVKIADFGMARYFSEPPPHLTQLVVTLWYRSPELILGAETYGRPVDVWSLGCIFGELLKKEPLMTGKNEVDQLSKIFELCGVPNEDTWPGFRRLPNARSLRLPRTEQNMGSVLRAKFPLLTGNGAKLLASLLELNPDSRPSTKQILKHPYFQEEPRAKAPSMFPSFPSKAGQERRRRIVSPSAPKRGEGPQVGINGADFSGIFSSRDGEAKGGGFQLKVV